MATVYRINPRYSGKKRIRVVNENGDLVDLVSKAAYKIEVAETKKKAAYELEVKPANQDDLAYHFSKGKQKVIQKMVNGKSVAWNAEPTQDVAPNTSASNTSKDKSDKSNDK